MFEIRPSASAAWPRAQVPGVILTIFHNVHHARLVAERMEG